MMLQNTFHVLIIQCLSSNFTLRVVEDDPKKDHRIAKIINKKNIFYVFSGKVVSAQQLQIKF